MPRLNVTLVIALAVALAALTLVRVADKAERGQQALVKWAPQLERLARGEDVYERSDSGLVQTEAPADGAQAEGFPTPPLSGLLLAPFARLGAVPGSVVFGVFKVGCAFFAAVVALRLGFEPGRVPAWAALIVLALTARVFASDLSHGNTNLVVLGALAAALLAHERHMPAMSGLMVALASVLKVTPLLFVLLFVVRRDRAALAGFGSGLLLFAVALPGAALGLATSFELLGSWAEQMLVPYLTGRPLTLLVTEHTNQSLFGVLARLTTNAVAIEARPGAWSSDVSIGIFALSEESFRWLHRGAALVVVLVTGWLVAQRRARLDGLRAYALLSLAMVALSERSWKQHYVVLALPVAYLVAGAWSERGKRRALAIAGLVCSAVLHGLSGEGLVGERASDLGEAYGVFLIGALALYVACGAHYSSEETGVAPEFGAR